MTRAEEERALDGLLRAGAGDPSPDDLRRLERRLAPWLETAPPKVAERSRWTRFKTALLLVGLGLVLPSEAFRVEIPSKGVRSTSAAVLVEPATRKDTGHASAFVPPTEGTTLVSSLPNAPTPSAPKHVPAALKSNAPPSAATALPVETSGAVDDSPHERGESESIYLRRAQSVLSDDPALALRMLEAHPQRFPRGGLVQERDVMLIDSLARLGRIDEARARARAFAAQYPQSAHESRIASILKKGSP
jgi:hypothetical protein